MVANSLKATLPSLQSTKVPQEPIPITENEGEKSFLALRAELSSSHASIYIHVAVFGSITAPIYIAAQPPHPRGASGGPDMAYYMTPFLPIILTGARHILCVSIFLVKDVHTTPTWSSYRHSEFSLQVLHVQNVNTMVKPPSH